MKKSMIIGLMLISILLISGIGGCTPSAPSKAAGGELFKISAMPGSSEEICALIPENKSAKGNCYIKIAAILKDSSLCSKIPSSFKSRSDDCYGILAFVKKDVSLCDKIINERGKEKCKNILGILNKDESLCGPYIEALGADSCLAVSTGDLAYCKGEDWCIERVNQCQTEEGCLSIAESDTWHAFTSIFGAYEDASISKLGSYDEILIDRVKKEECEDKATGSIDYVCNAIKSNDLSKCIDETETNEKIKEINKIDCYVDVAWIKAYLEGK